jgi:hypothetical protein
LRSVCGATLGIGANFKIISSKKMIVVMLMKKAIKFRKKEGNVWQKVWQIKRSYEHFIHNFLIIK